MSGLGIVLEESDSPVLLRTGFLPKEKTTIESETLLPPLLHELDLPEKPVPILVLGSSAGSASPSLSSPSDSGVHPQLPQLDQDLQSLVVPTGFTSESSEIEFDSKLLSFPSIEPPTPALTTFLNLLASLSTQPSQQAGSVNSSPLSRLKSLKKGIRKLSLSRIGSSISLAASSSTPPIDQSPVATRINLSPTQMEYHNDLCSLSSNSDSSPLSTFSGLGLRNASCSCPPSYGKHSSTAESCQLNSTSALPHTNSVGQILLPKSRRRTLSQSYWSGNASTLPQPIITLSDNLPSSSENLSSVNQSFFGTLSQSPLSGHTSNADSTKQHFEDSGDALDKLNTPEELIDYLIYLSEHKKSVEEAYAVAKDRLLSSGWCSKHDIENLNLQRDVALSQIDTKILKIEAKLNSEFSVSMLNNIDVLPSTKSNNGRKPEITREPLSPSLKVLEKKYLLFSLEQQAILH